MLRCSARGLKEGVAGGRIFVAQKRPDASLLWGGGRTQVLSRISSFKNRGSLRIEKFCHSNSNGSSHIKN